jgi:UDP-N-acetylmuramate: L-alanyl-gamma-D-glutamyl-meso-diaminopimelate ligase
MHIHILGVCGTFMGGLALLAREAGHRVEGSDANVYPPMSTQLAEQGIGLMQGYEARHLDPAPDLVLVGNAMSRGNPAVEAMLNRRLPYTSGPQWLGDYILQQRWVLAVAGTHGKTTTTSMLAWILDYAGLEPGFLIGGIPNNFGVSARLGASPFFVIEADEYDTAFFDKRSKFVHYRPRTLILNNLEYDHADIFPDLASIQRQFHHLVRIVPGEGLIVAAAADRRLQEVLAAGCWTPVETLSCGDAPAMWQPASVAADGSEFDVTFEGKALAHLNWSQLGMHNVHNALAAIAAARHVGVPVAQSVAALAQFKGVKRRMEVRGVVNGVTVYDDFAHHPTAIQTTLEGLRRNIGGQRIIVLLEPRSNTMRMGIHVDSLPAALAAADHVCFFQDGDLDWDLTATARRLAAPAEVYHDIAALVDAAAGLVRPGDHLLVMSNGGFGGIHEKLLERLGRVTA